MIPSHQPLVVFNPASNHGRGAARWRRLLESSAAIAALPVVTTDPQGHWRAQVADEIARGRRRLVAAGGDGTVNDLLDVVVVASLDAGSLSDFTIGAVGLGSSNDFHKPGLPGIHGLPVRCDWQETRARDVCRAVCTLADGAEVERFFLINASVGVGAEANLAFNQARGILGWLKPRWVGGAILFAVLRTILRFENLPAVLGVGEESLPVEISNLAVLKSPHVSGSFTFESPFEPASGSFRVHLAQGMRRPRLLMTLARLARGRFIGYPKTRSWEASEVRIACPRPFALELDGEVLAVTAATLEILPEKIMECGPGLVLSQE